MYTHIVRDGNINYMKYYVDKISLSVMQCNDSSLPRAHPTESYDLFNYLAKKRITCSVASLATARHRKSLE